MNTGTAPATWPDRLVSKIDSAAAIRARMQRIKEDIAAAVSKIERIQCRIERDRQALLLWQARLSATSDEQRRA